MLKKKKNESGLIKCLLVSVVRWSYAFERDATSPVNTITLSGAVRVFTGIAHIPQGNV